MRIVSTHVHIQVYDKHPYKRYLSPRCGTYFFPDLTVSTRVYTTHNTEQNKNRSPIYVQWCIRRQSFTWFIGEWEDGTVSNVRTVTCKNNQTVVANCEGKTSNQNLFNWCLHTETEIKVVGEVLFSLFAGHGDGRHCWK